MSKRTRKNRGNTDHRGNTRELAREYQLKMSVVHRIPPVYYSNDGEVKRAEREFKK